MELLVDSPIFFVAFRFAFLYGHFYDSHFMGTAPLSWCSVAPHPLWLLPLCVPLLPPLFLVEGSCFSLPDLLEASNLSAALRDQHRFVTNFSYRGMTLISAHFLSQQSFDVVWK